MALQVFTPGQTLTASQMNTLQASTYNYATATVSASTHTLESTDAGYILIFTSNADPVEVTVPAGLAMAAGDSIEIIYGGTGSLELIPAVGVTIYSEGDLKTLHNQWARVSLIRTASNTYILSWMTSIVEQELGDSSVTTSKINNQAITSAKLSPNISIGGTLQINEVLENATVSAAPLSGATNINALDGLVYYWTANAAANWQWNLRGDASNTLDSVMSYVAPIGQSITFAFLCTIGSSAFKLSALTIDSLPVSSIKWFGGNSYPAGNASSVDVYTVTAVKTGSNQFTAFVSQSKFA